MSSLVALFAKKTVNAKNRHAQKHKKQKVSSGDDKDEMGLSTRSSHLNIMDGKKTTNAFIWMRVWGGLAMVGLPAGPAHLRPLDDPATRLHQFSTPP